MNKIFLIKVVQGAQSDRLVLRPRQLVPDLMKNVLDVREVGKVFIQILYL